MSDVPTLDDFKPPIMKIDGKEYPVTFNSSMNPSVIRFKLNGVLVATRQLTFQKTILFDSVELHPDSYWMMRNLKKEAKGP